MCSEGSVYSSLVTCTVISPMAEDESTGQFPPLTLEQLQWIDRLMTMRTETDNSRVENAVEDTSTPVSGHSPISLVIPAAGCLTSTNTLVTPASRGGKWGN